MRFLTSPQCRAARGLLDWSQPELAKKCGMHVQTISAFENETSTPTKTTLEKVKLAFENAGIEFSKYDGVCKKEDLIVKYDGVRPYYDFLLDAFEVLKVTKDEYLLSGSDDRRSPPEVVELHRKMKKSKIPIRQLIENKNTYIMEDLETYRWMPEGNLTLFGSCQKNQPIPQQK